MPRRAHAPAARTAAVTVALTALSLGSLAAAQADESPAPVTADDTTTIEARTVEFGGVSFVDVLANDRSVNDDDLEICRVRAPRRGLSAAEVGVDGSFEIQSPAGGVSVGGGSVGSDGSVEEGARESIAVLPWANRAGTFTFTYWACDTEHLTPATVTVTVTRTPQVTVRKADRPGRLRFTNPRANRAVVLYAGPGQEPPYGRVGLAPRSSETRRVEFRKVVWVAISPRTGEPLASGIVRGIRLPGSANRSGDVAPGAESELTARMLRAWRSAHPRP
ncbi:hypothetical protein [Nocardioides dongxiaopingii]|uniref:hypothetical protein n=1 Tax=Nocardioides dongxiaopingii TaxID=2576036 RepID=UPI0010C769FE|nr:hypothetical protein [Nocardioides dongxiaopingii]